MPTFLASLIFYFHIKFRCTCPDSFNSLSGSLWTQFDISIYCLASELFWDFKSSQSLDSQIFNAYKISTTWTTLSSSAASSRCTLPFIQHSSTDTIVLKLESSFNCQLFWAGNLFKWHYLFILFPFKLIKISQIWAFSGRNSAFRSHFWLFHCYF